MITGIGTPNSHNRSPRPIVASSSSPVFHNRTDNADRPTRFPPHVVNVLRTAAMKLTGAHQCPVLGIDTQGSCGGFGSPFCNSSIECRSGERTKAMLPSRGGRLMVMPSFISRSQVA